MTDEDDFDSVLINDDLFLSLEELYKEVVEDMRDGIVYSHSIKKAVDKIEGLHNYLKMDY